jgi:hypothetical protein
MVAKQPEDDVDNFLNVLSDAFCNFNEEDCCDSDIRQVKKIPTAKRVPRIPYSSITAEDFARDYSATNTPILLGDAPCAPMHLTIDYWRANHSSDLVPLDLSTPMERIVRMGDFLKFDGETRNGYMRSLHTAEWCV